MTQSGIVTFNREGERLNISLLRGEWLKFNRTSYKLDFSSGYLLFVVKGICFFCAVKLEGELYFTNSSVSRLGVSLCLL